jgi:hypothetical protein
MIVLAHLSTEVGFYEGIVCFESCLSFVNYPQFFQTSPAKQLDELIFDQT